jgi:hypothetical protein
MGHLYRRFPLQSHIKKCPADVLGGCLMWRIEGMPIFNRGAATVAVGASHG